MTRARPVLAPSAARLGGALVLALGLAAPAGAQAFDPGPAGTVVGSSMSGARIGFGRKPLSRHIPGAEVFGDTVEERTYGKPFDDSYLTPPVRRSGRDVPTELRATEGRADLNGVNAGAYARGEANIGISPVTRPSLGGRARIRR